MDFTGQPATISSVDGPRKHSKARLKVKVAPRKCHGHYSVICCQSDPLQRSESRQNHYIWEVCSANQWDAPKTAVPAARIGQQNGPNSSPLLRLTAHHASDASEVEQISLRCFRIWLYSPDLLATDYHFFKHLDNILQGKCFHSQQEAENAFQEFWNPRTPFFTLRE